MSPTTSIRRLKRLRSPMLALVLAALTSCTSDSLPPDVPVTINFAVVVDNAPFVCGETYSGLGSTGTDMGFVDMRFYVHDIAMVDANGTEYPVTLDMDGIWQRDGVALLDFENGCENGTAQINTSVTGIAPRGKHVGVRFSVGVPPELNSSETVLEGRGSPLNQAAMFWSWKSGYKYVRIDGDNGPFRLHLGAANCSADFVCDDMNIPRLTLSGFDAARHQIQLNVSDLIKGTDITQNSPSTAPGCMGDPNDPDCEDMFERIGLGDEANQTAWTVVELANGGAQ